MTIEVGEQAPDFELRDQHKQPVRLSDLRGKRNALVVFLPFAFSRGCTKELCEMRDDLSDFSNDDTQVLAITCDSPFANAAWAQQENTTFPLLSDYWPHGEITRAYGVFEEHIGSAVRATFLVDREGIVRWKVVNAIPDTRDLDEYRAALAELA